MKKIIIAIMTIIHIVQGGETDSSMLDKSIKDKVTILENEGEHEISREIISQYMDDNNVKDSMSFWLKMDRKLFNDLNQNIKNQLTCLPFSDKNKVDSLDVVNMMLYSLPIYGAIKGAYDYGAGENIVQKTIKSYKEYEINQKIKNCQKVKSPTDICIAPEKVKQKLALYEILKKSQENLKKQLSIYLKRASKKELNNIIQILKQQNKLKKQIKDSRTNYISYNVISPYLAEAQRNIELSNRKKLIGHNKDYLSKAAILMARGAYKDILLQANKDTRKQFYTVYQMLKETAGDKEWEDLKVLQTLMNSASTAKKTGADLWWD